MAIRVPTLAPVSIHHHYGHYERGLGPELEKPVSVQTDVDDGIDAVDLGCVHALIDEVG